MRKTFSKKRTGKKTRRNKKTLSGGNVGELYGGVVDIDAGLSKYTLKERSAYGATSYDLDRFNTPENNDVINRIIMAINSGMRNSISRAAAVKKTMTLFTNVSSIDAAARRTLIKMLNEQAINPPGEYKISYPHIWEDINEDNESTKILKIFPNWNRFGRRDWLRHHPLYKDLKFKSITPSEQPVAPNGQPVAPNGEQMALNGEQMALNGQPNEEQMEPNGPINGGKNRSKKYKKRKTRRKTTR